GSVCELQRLGGRLVRWDGEVNLVSGDIGGLEWTRMAQPTEVKGEHRSVLLADDAKVQTLGGLADFNVVGHAIEQREHDVVGDAVEPENRYRISAESRDDFQPRIARDDGRAEKEARGGRADDELRGLLRAAQSLADERNRGLDGGIDLLEKC